MKTAELTGAQLDYWAGRAAGIDKQPGVRVSDHPDRDGKFSQGGRFLWSPHTGALFVFRPSTDWAQGGPLIERYGISLDMRGSDWIARTPLDQVMIADDEPLRAAMLAICVSKFGWEVSE